MTYAHYSSFNDHFCSDMFQAWADIHCTQPENAGHVCHEIQWYNTNIRLNLCLVKYKNRQKSINFVQDLLDAQENLATADYPETEFDRCDSLQ